VKKPLPITTLFVDVGGVLLTNGWDHLARRRAAKKFGLNWPEMDQRHRLVFETHEEGKLSFEEYLGWVVFYEKRPFTRNQFRDFMFAQSKAYPKMLGLLAQLKMRNGLKIVVISNESREVNAYRIRTFKLDRIVDTCRRGSLMSRSSGSRWILPRLLRPRLSSLTTHPCSLRSRIASACTGFFMWITNPHAPNWLLWE
jgi:beta-phosphoglucomutase-like phosphatase (HAD superfamily)